jgi:hypothetical protein
MQGRRRRHLRPLRNIPVSDILVSDRVVRLILAGSSIMSRIAARILTTLSLLFAVLSPLFLSQIVGRRNPSKVVTVSSEGPHPQHHHRCGCDCCGGR